MGLIVPKPKEKDLDLTDLPIKKAGPLDLTGLPVRRDEGLDLSLLPVRTQEEPQTFFEQAKPEDRSAWDRLTGWITGASKPNATPHERARAANIIGLAEAEGIPPHKAEENYQSLMSEMGVEQGPSTFDLAMLGLITFGGVQYGVLRTAAGIAQFSLLQKAVDSLSQLAAKYVPWETTEKTGGQGKGLIWLLPEFSSETVKTYTEIAEFLIEGKALHLGMKAEGKAYNAVMEKFFRETIIERSLPRNVFVSPEKVRSMFGLKPNEPISPMEMELVRELRLGTSEYHDAMEYGLDLSVPAELIVRLVDKPYWSRIKGLFSMRPYERVVEVQPAPSPVRIAGRLIAPGEEPIIYTIKPLEAKKPASILPEGFDSKKHTLVSDGQGGWYAVLKEKGPHVARDRTEVEIKTDLVDAKRRIELTPDKGAKKIWSDQAVKLEKELEAVKPDPDLYTDPLPDIAKGVYEADLKQSVSESDIHEYNTLQMEAKRRAARKMSGDQRKQIKLMLTDIKKQARETIETSQLYVSADEAVKIGGLNLDALKRDYDQETVNELLRWRPGLFTKKSTMGADSFSTQYGFESVDEMVEAWLDAPTKAQAIEKAALQLESQLELEAEAGNVDLYIDVLDEEISILNQMLGRKKHKVPGIKKYIRETSGMVKTGRLVDEGIALKAGLKKAEKAARTAFREGNKEGTLAEKERQREIALRLKNRVQARNEIKGIDKALNRYIRLKGIPVEYREHLLSLLGGYYRVPKSFVGQPPKESLRTFLEDREAGDEVISLLDQVPAPQNKKYLTVEELNAVLAMADALVHLAKIEKKLIAEEKERDLELTLRKVNHQIYTTHPVQFSDEFTLLPSERKLSFLESFTDPGHNFFSSLMKPEFITRALDGYEEMGPVWEEIFRPIARAETEEFKRGGEIMERLTDAFKEFDKEWAAQKYRIQPVPNLMTKEEIVMVALNSGNEGNRKTLRSGFKKEDGTGWTDEDIDLITSVLTDKEWDLVNQVWEIIDTLWQPLSDVFMQLTGTRLKKVEGRYFPLHFDRDISWRADRNAAETEARDFFQTIYSKPKPESGMTKERTGGRLPPLLSFSVINKHVKDTVHWLTHILAVRDINKIISHESFRMAVNQSLGDHVYKQLPSYLQFVAKPRMEPINQLEKWVGRFRRNSTVVMLGMKLSVAVKQPMALTQTINELGLWPVIKAMNSFYTHPWQSRDFIKSRSLMMKNRRRSWDRELAQFYDKATSNFKENTAIRDSFFALIGIMDRSVVYPSWLAGYTEGMEKFKGDEAQAIEYADMIVRRTHDVASPKDLSEMQRGSELRKVLTMFLTFFTSMNNLLMELHGRVRLGKISMPELIKSYYWLLLFPAVMETVISTGIREKRLPTWQEAGKGIISFRLAGFPIFRDLAGPLLSGYSYTMSPVESGLKVLAERLPQAVTAEEEKAWKVTRYTIEALGYLFGLPSRQAVITLEGAMKLIEGETKDPSRLLFPSPRKKKK